MYLIYNSLKENTMSRNKPNQVREGLLRENFSTNEERDRERHEKMKDRHPMHMNW